MKFKEDLPTFYSQIVFQLNGILEVQFKLL